MKLEFYRQIFENTEILKHKT